MSKHLSWLIERHPALECCADDIKRVFETMRESYRDGGKVLLCGNGGSAADAEHWSGELLKGFEKKRPLDAAAKARLAPPIASALQGGLPAIPLTGFTSLSTAFANDVRPDFIFAQLVWGLGVPGDVLIGISTSGNAKNVCYAVEAAKAKDLVTIGLTGRGGGRLSEIADMSIHVPADRPCEVQEYHMPVYHCISLMLEDEFFPKA